MRHDIGVTKKLWVYNEHTGSLRNQNLVFRYTDCVESWYEHETTYETHDPFYVDDNKDRLVKRVSKSLNRELKEALTSAKKLTKRLKELAKVK